LDEVDRIRLRFDQDTNRAEMFVGSPCGILLTDSTVNEILSGTATDLTCVWASASVVNLRWKGVSAFIIGTSIRTRADVLVSADGFSAAAPVMEALLTTEAKYAPAVVITGPKLIGNCEGVLMDAGNSLGSGGRAFSSTWELVSATPATGVAALDSVQLGKIRVLLPVDSDRAMVELPGDFLPVSQAYLFQVTLTNWLGNLGKGTLSVTKDANSLPIITAATTVLYIERKEAVSVTVTVEGGECGAEVEGASEKAALMTVWTLASNYLALRIW
jgi:hypothetical protein